MKTIQKDSRWAVVIIAFLVIGCGMFGGNEVKTVQNGNSASPSNAAAPMPATPKTFQSTALVTAVIANEPELAKMLGKDPVIVTGDVWSGGDYQPARLEFWGREGRITCSGYTNTLPPEKLVLWKTLEKATGDYVNNRVKRMPSVKAKGIYASSIKPAAKPDDHWRVFLEDCELLEVTP